MTAHVAKRGSNEGVLGPLTLGLSLSKGVRSLSQQLNTTPFATVGQLSFHKRVRKNTYWEIFIALPPPFLVEVRLNQDNGQS